MAKFELHSKTEYNNNNNNITHEWGLGKVECSTSYYYSMKGRDVVSSNSHHKDMENIAKQSTLGKVFLWHTAVTFKPIFEADHPRKQMLNRVAKK